MSDEPVIFVVERRPGGARGDETPSLFRGPLPEYLTAPSKQAGGANRLVYAWRLDRLPNGAALAQMPLGDLFDQWKRLRAEGKLPPSNMADPPRKVEGGQKGIERGPETWWKPKPLPRPLGWSPEMDRRTRVPWAQPTTVGFEE